MLFERAIASKGVQQRFLYFALLLFFVYPMLIDKAPGLHLVGLSFAAVRYIITIVAIGMFFVRRLRLGILLPIAVFQTAIIISASITGTLYLTYLLSCVTFIGFAALNYELYKIDEETLCSTYRLLLFILIIVDFVTKVAFPNGMVAGHVGDTRIWLLGTKNMMALYVIAYSYLLLRSIEKKRGRGTRKDIRRDIVLLLLPCMLSIYVPSSTDIVVIVLVVVYLVLMMNGWGRIQIIDCLLFVGACLFFVVFVLFGNSNTAGNAITSLFGKASSFSGRQPVWQLAIEDCMKKPLGVGVYAEFNPWENSGIFVYSAHNTILDIAVRAGIATAIYFLIMFVVVIFRCEREKKNSILGYCLILLFLASMMEANQGYYIFWTLIIFGMISPNYRYRGKHSLHRKKPLFFGARSRRSPNETIPQYPHEQHDAIPPGEDSKFTIGHKEGIRLMQQRRQRNKGKYVVSILQ